MLIVYDAIGRLGNRLQIATYTIAYAVERDMKLRLHCMKGYEKLFAFKDGSCEEKGCERNIKLVQIYSWIRGLLSFVLRILERMPYIQNLVKVRILRGTPNYPLILTDEPVEELIRNSWIVFIRGYYVYCDPVLLLKHKSLVKELFKPSDIEMCNKVDSGIEQLRNKGNTLVAIHIRRSDYSEYKGGKYFFSHELYAGYMKSFIRSYDASNVVFVVCSDEMIPDEVFDGLNWISGPGTLMGDLYTMSKCDFLIGPHSTFNRWSAFYGEVQRLEIESGFQELNLFDFKKVTDLIFPIQYAI